MMVHPLIIIEEETKGKGRDEVLRLIREWEAYREYWNTVDKHPETYRLYHGIEPGPDIHEWFYQMGLPILKEKYAALGGDYKADKAKSDAYLFDKRLGKITGLRLTKRADTALGADVYELKVDAEGKITFRKGWCSDPDAEPPLAPFSHERKELVGFLKKMGFGAWSRTYEPRDDWDLDGESWELEITFSSGEPFRSVGRNEYPENFDAFLLLFGETQPSEDFSF